MGNACCQSKDLSHYCQNTNQELITPAKGIQICSSLDQIEDCYSDASLSPVHNVTTLPIFSKGELDFQQTTFNTRRRTRGNTTSDSQPMPLLRKATLVMNISKSPRQSIRITHDAFVTLKQSGVEISYEICEKIGQGSYGSVHRVIHRQTGMVRAMKQISKAKLIVEDQQRMLSEINILKQLDHPNIVKVFEFYQDNECYYIITEYLSGGELFHRIKKLTLFSEKTAASYIRQILKAVSYCHEKKITHRDLKPENILFVSESDSNQMKIIDFGTSRVFDSKVFMSKRLGTPYYIAPEVLRQEYTEKVDVWSCGVILYILLCGYPPFAGRNDEETLKKVTSANLYFQQSDWSLISVYARDLVQQMLNKNPKYRISAKDALMHPWIVNNTAASEPNQQVLMNIQKFQAQNVFQKAILSFIVNQQLQPTEMKDLYLTFQSLDKNHDGFLSTAELVQGYSGLMPNKIVAEQHVLQILEFVDINLSGFVDYSEFVMAAMNYEKLASTERVKQAFRMLDMNQDGYLSKNELEEIMGKLGEDVWEEYLLDCDYNQDGKISEEEFITQLLSKQPQQ